MARPPGQLGPPSTTKGRRKGSLDAGQRKLISEEIARDILDVYQGLGGVGFLLEFAKANPRDFLSMCLARLMPAFPKENPDIQINQQFNGDAGTDLDVARRVAFMLAKAAHDLEDASGTELAAYTYTPARPYDRDVTPQVAPEPRPDLIGDMPADGRPIDYNARDEWAQGLASTPDEQACRETQTASLETYRGAAGEGRVDMPRRTESPRRRR